MDRLLLLIFLIATACANDAVVDPQHDSGLRGVNAGADQGRQPVDMSGAPPDAAPPADATTPPDAESPPDMTGASGPPFVVPGVQGSYDVNFTVAIEGRSQAPVGDISVTAGAGFVELDGTTVPVGVYQRQEWDAFGYTLYQGLAVASDRWWVIWFYCQGDELTDVYYQGTSGPKLATVPANGTCTGTTTASQVDVDFPATSVAIEPLLDTFTVSGPTIDIQPGKPGTFTVGATDFEIYVFGHVDCTTECGPDGWHELHSVARNPTTNELCFTIFYLYADDRQAIAAYSFSLPSLADPFGGTVGLQDVTWTGP